MDNQRLIKQLLIWGGLLIFLLLVLWGYNRDWWQRDFSQIDQQPIVQSRQAIDDKLVEIGHWGERIYLADMSGGQATGEAAYRFMNDQYEQMVVAELPELAEGYFYEGWLVRTGTKGQISIGKMLKQPDGRHTLLFKDSRNYSDFDRVIVTLEPADANPEPAKKILEGGYK